MKRVLLCVAALAGCAGAGEDAPEPGAAHDTAHTPGQDDDQAAIAPTPVDVPPAPPALRAPEVNVQPEDTAVAEAATTAPVELAPAGADAVAATGSNEAPAPAASPPASASTTTLPPEGRGIDIAPYPDVTSGAGAPRPYGPEPPPVVEWIDIVLRSTPPGATVSVDGALVGTTPAFWRGAKLPVVREFKFEFERFQTAEFRFVPVRSGVLHPTLVPTRLKPDAGP